MFVLLISALVAVVCAADAADKTFVIDAQIYDDKFIVYTSEHDIVNLVFPVNNVNLKGDDFQDELSLFFTEVDIGANGEKDYKGLYVLSNHTAHKLLDNGRDSAAAYDNSKKVYFAASDGIYVYNADEKKAEKYGSLTDNFIHILQANGTDETILYVINDKYEMFKVTGEGTKKEKLAVTNAQEFVIDTKNNIYFYDDQNQVYILNEKGITKVQGLKTDPKYIHLLKPIALFQESVFLILDDQLYVVFANGKTMLSGFEIKDKPTGYGLEGTFYQYLAYNKKIYEYNMFELGVLAIFNELKDYAEYIETIEKIFITLISALA